MLDRSRIHEAGHVIDEHRELRLDVDNMTYEVCLSFGLVNSLCAFFSENVCISSYYFPSHTLQELVALEEQIGNVNTGLTESYIQENLRSTFYVPGAAGVCDQFSELSLENDACIICQEEYEAEELIGTLECGHKYHATCIKQWLVMKNLCPICKTTALSSDSRNG